jgi:transcriptional regulator with XRE-family HTH domain
MSEEKQSQEKESQEFGQRLKAIRRHLKLKQKDFAERIGIKNNYLSSIEKGKIKPGFDFFKKLTDEYRINLYYLFHDEGPMFLEKKHTSSLEEKDFGEANRRVHEMIDIISRSPMVKFDMLGFFTRYLIQNQSIIEKDIEINKKETEENKREID